jgi:hypothetical protein
MIVSEKKKTVCSSKDVSEVLLSLLNFEQEHDREKEHFWILGLNTKNVVQYADLVSLGSLTAAIVHTEVGTGRSPYAPPSAEARLMLAKANVSAGKSRQRFLLISAADFFGCEVRRQDRPAA